MILQPLIDWCVANSGSIALGVGGPIAGMIFRHISPRLAGFMKRNLDAFLGWVQHADDDFEVKTGVKIPEFLHNIWDKGWGATIGAVEQAAGDPEFVYQAFRIAKGQSDLRQKRFLDLLEAHIKTPDFAGIVVSNLPSELKEVWNEMKDTEAVKAIVAKSAATSTPVTPAAAQVIVKNLAPAARVLAAENPIETNPMSAADIQAKIDKSRAELAKLVEKK